MHSHAQRGNESKINKIWHFANHPYLCKGLNTLEFF